VLALELEFPPAVLRSLVGLCPPRPEPTCEHTQRVLSIAVASCSAETVAELVALPGFHINRTPVSRKEQGRGDDEGSGGAGKGAGSDDHDDGFSTCKNACDSVLHLAAERGDVQVIELLLHVGASPRALDGAGLTPLDRSRLRGRERASALLLAWSRANQMLLALAGASAREMHDSRDDDPLVQDMGALGPRVRGWLVPWLEAAIMESGEEIPKRGFNVM
jgi:hypothetical protein